MKLRAPNRLLLLQLLLAVGMIAALVWWGMRQPSFDIPTSESSLTLLAVSLGLYALTTLVRAERWHRVLTLSVIRPSRRDTYALTTVGYMGNNVLPARSGELLRTFLLAHKENVSRRSVLGTILAERVLDAFVLGILLVAVAFGLIQHIRPSSLTLLAIVAGGGLFLCVVAYFILRRGKLYERLKSFLIPLAKPTRLLLTRRGIPLVAMSFLVWTLEASVYLTVAHALNIQLSILDSLALMAFVNLVSLIPAAPGYVGTFEAAVVFALKALKQGHAAALPYVLLLRFVLFVPITLVGLVALIARYGGLSRLRLARADTAA